METKRIFRHKQDESKEPYLYTACGLDNVYLLNGYELHRLEDSEGVSVRDLDDLHEAIGQSLVQQAALLQSRELRWFRIHLDLTRAQLAEHLGCDSKTVAQWEKGECPISRANDQIIRELYLNKDNTSQNPSPAQPHEIWKMDQAQGFLSSQPCLYYPLLP